MPTAQLGERGGNSISDDEVMFKVLQAVATRIISFEGYSTGFKVQKLRICTEKK